MLWNLLRSFFRPGVTPTRLVERGLALRRQGRLRDAEHLLRDAAIRFPRDATVATNLGVALLEQDSAEDGVTWLERALELDPRFAPAHYNLANVMRGSGRRDLALPHYQSTLDADPDFAPAREELLHCLLEVCDWDRADLQSAALRALIARAPATQWMRCVSPLTALYLGLETRLRKEVAQYHAAEYARDIQPVARSAVAVRSDGKNEPLRIAYLSRDFRNHPVGQLVANAFAMHDRARVEVHAFSYGRDDGSTYRQAIAAGVDHFVDAHVQTDAELAASIAKARIQVLVDLGGHTTGNRLAVLARRPAPVQVHYLGFPATTGASYIDYFITDRVATPPQLSAEFTEKLAFLPHCFMVSDGADALNNVDKAAGKEQFPTAAIVYCNFNNHSRITREIFHAWMKILQAVPQGVLWLQGAGTLTVANLHREAQTCGVDPARLYFAERVPGKRQHLARLARADMVLDTVGWHNGHSSTSDALWAGVPVLTAPMEHFAGRVAASLATAAGLPELVTRDRDEYVNTAIALGNDRTQLAALKRKLAENRRSAPFFDTRRTVRALEDAYLDMWKEYCGGATRNSL